MRGVELIGLGVGALVCGLPYLFYGASAPPFRITLLTLTVASAGLALLSREARWPTGGGVGLGLVLVVGMRIAVDLSQDATSHNLWPFEIVGALVVGLPPAMLGAFAGGRLRGIVPWPAVTGVGLMAGALVVAGGTARATAAEMVRLEALAVTRVGALVAAEQAFRTAHPQRGFTCDLTELGALVPGAVEKNTPSESYRRGGVVYRGGTAMIADAYRYSLKCAVQPDPQESFVLTARALVEEGDTRPLEIFCASADGAIRAITSGRLYSCFAEGRVVQAGR
jgi:hypothetical protein